MKVLIALLISSFSFAQDAYSSGGGTMYNSQNYIVDKANANDNYYINKEYINGVIKNYKGTRKYRYNAFTDNFEYLDGNKLYNLEKQDNLHITLDDNEVYLYKSFTNEKGNLLNGYLKFLSDMNNKNVLYKSERITKSELGNTNSYNNMNTVKYRKIITFYIGNDSGINEVSKSNKQLNQIAKENKVNLNKEQDLIKLVNFLNQ